MRAVTVACAVVAGVLVAPVASASACPSFSKLSAFRGTAGTSFSGSASGSDGSGGTVTVSLARSASGLKVALLNGGSSVGGDVFTGSVTGGASSVNDHYADTGSGGSRTMAQTGSGPTGAADAELVRLPSTCTYQLQVSWGIETTVTSSGNPPSSGGAGGFALTPLKPIPASLELSGSATVPAYSGPCPRGENPKGCYAYGGGSGDPFGETYHELKSCGSTSCNPGNQSDATATISWHLYPEKPQCVVPKLKGKTLAQAKSALQAAGCKLGKVTYKTDFTLSKGDKGRRVLSSSPAAGKKLAAGAKVDLVISLPPCLVPNLDGDFASDAPSLLHAANCTLGKVTKKYSFTGVAKGKIISSSPKAGSKLYFGAPVAITVSLGPAYCNVPKFLPGNTLKKAKLLLSNSNNFCSVGKLTYQHSSKYAKGTVITSHPKPGTKKRPAGTPVNLTISSGP